MTKVNKTKTEVKDAPVKEVKDAPVKAKAPFAVMNGKDVIAEFSSLREAKAKAQVSAGVVVKR